MPKTQLATNKREVVTDGRADFFVQTGSMRKGADADGENQPTVLATASSDAVDLEADRFTSKALKQMKVGFVGKLIFLNHSYSVPQDVFGVVKSAELIKREGRLDLDLEIAVEMNNPLAVQTYQYIVNGTRLGVSVGVIVTDAEKSDDEDAYGNTIFDIGGVIPLEASVVGIPANQTAWTRQAIKSLVLRGALDLDTSQVEARPWLKTVTKIDAKKDAPTNLLSKETRVWVTDEDGEVIVEITGEDKDAIMAKRKNADDEIKDEDVDEEKDADGDDKEAEPDETKDDDDSEENDDSEEKKDDDSEEDEDDKEAEPDEKKDEDDKEAEPDEKKDEDDKEAEPDEKKDEEKEAEPDEKKDFDEDVAADEAADTLISKMYTGMYVALNNLIPIILNTDSSVADRTKEGEEVIKEWAAFVENTWSDITGGLDGDKAVERTEIDVSSALHGIIAAGDTDDCQTKGMEAVTEKVKDIGDAGEAIAEENTGLNEKNAQLMKAITFMQDVVEQVMKLPLATVTTRGGKVAQSLAEQFPTLDNRVVERMARYSANSQEKE